MISSREYGRRAPISFERDLAIDEWQARRNEVIARDAATVSLSYARSGFGLPFTDLRDGFTVIIPLPPRREASKLER